MLVTVFVLATGNLLGTVVKGLSGFGGAIINILVWVLGKAVGLDAGTLQQAVMAECVSGVVIAAPFIGLTRAWETADWQIVGGLALFTVVGSPLGATMLKYLNSRIVEGVMAVTLLLAIGMQCNALQVADHMIRRLLRWGRTPASRYQRIASDGTEVSVGLTRRAPAAAAGADGGASSAAKAREQQPRELELGVVVAADNVEADDDRGAVLWQPDDVGVAEAGLLEFAAPQRPSSRHSDSGSDKGTPEPELPAPQERPTPAAWWRRAKPRETGHSTLRVVCYACAAGFASGVMSGLTGMGGPPMMIMYAQLQTPKDVVRASNAVLNVPQLLMRAVSYTALGEFSRQDMPIYVCASVLGLAGLFLGHWWAHSIDQQAFSRLLVALMCLCCLLMMLSAAGIVA